MRLLLKCFYKLVFYLWSDLTLHSEHPHPAVPSASGLLPAKIKAALLVSTLNWEPSHHAHGYFFLIKFISSYLYESLLCQLVCIAYFVYKIKI